LKLLRGKRWRLVVLMRIFRFDYVQGMGSVRKADSCVRGVVGPSCAY
jgi:hypothetical protein